MATSYEEYSEYINDTYQEFKEERMSSKEAIARTFNEYDMSMKKSETDKAVISVTIAEILVTHVRVLNTFKDYMIEIISKLNFELIQQEDRISNDQYSELVLRRDKVLESLDNKPLDYYPRGCWYYEELTNQINEFVSQINIDAANEEEIITRVLKHFERDVKNTLSEKMIVYVTLSENILNSNHNRTKNKIIDRIKEELQLFNVEEIVHEQLTDEERQRLVVRIDNVLEKFGNAN